jgi:hypothetical protein
VIDSTSTTSTTRGNVTWPNLPRPLNPRPMVMFDNDSMLAMSDTNGAIAIIDATVPLSYPSFTYRYYANHSRSIKLYQDILVMGVEIGHAPIATYTFVNITTDTVISHTYHNISGSLGCAMEWLWLPNQTLLVADRCLGRWMVDDVSNLAAPVNIATGPQLSGDMEQSAVTGNYIYNINGGGVDALTFSSPQEFQYDLTTTNYFEHSE